MRRHQLNLWQVFFLLAFFALGLYWGEQRGFFDQTRGKVEEGVIWLRNKSSVTYKTNTTYTELRGKIVSQEEKIRLLEEENESLRKQLQAPLPPGMKFIVGKVIGQVGGEEGLLIAAGKREEVKEGMAVVKENILVGRVSSVTPRMSQVRLLVDQETKVAVKTEGGARGIITGNSKFQILNSVLLDRVLQSEELTVGEKVLTSGEDGLPPDLLVGKVLEVFTEEREPFKKAVVELFVEPGEVKKVFVISDY